MGSKSSKSANSNSYQQDYSSGSQYPRVYPHIVPEPHHHQYPIYEHRPNPPYVTAIPNTFNLGQVQNVAHVQGEYRPQEYSYPQPTNRVVLPSPTAPPLSLISQANRMETQTSTIDKPSKSHHHPQDEDQMTEKLKSLNRFLKGILASVPEHYARKGYYCEGCNCGLIRIPATTRRSHNSSESHLQLITDAMIERYCPICRIDLLCTDLLWRQHEESEIHKFWKEKSEKNCGAVQERKEDEFNGKKAYLMVSSFPGSTSWKKLKLFFQEFGDVVRVEMGKNHGSEFARVFFRKRMIALNIHESGFPLIFENRRLSTRVEWMV